MSGAHPSWPMYGEGCQETRGYAFRPWVPAPSAHALFLAVKAIRNARQPLILAGNGVIRGNATDQLYHFADKLRIPVTTTFMGMGALPADDELFVSTTGLQSRDYISCGFDRADLIITVGYDPVEFNPEYWDGKKEIIHINFTAADVDKNYRALEIIGNIRDTLAILTQSLADEKDPSLSSRMFLPSSTVLWIIPRISSFRRNWEG